MQRSTAFNSEPGTPQICQLKRSSDNYIMVKKMYQKNFNMHCKSNICFSLYTLHITENIGSSCVLPEYFSHIACLKCPLFKRHIRKVKPLLNTLQLQAFEHNFSSFNSVSTGYPSYSNKHLKMET